MKEFTSLLLLAALNVSAADVCKHFNSSEVRELLEASESVKKFVADDNTFANLRGKLRVNVQKEINGMRVVPIDFSDPKHSLDYQVLGEIEAETFYPDGKPSYSRGTAIKVGRSCIATSAHILYGSTHQAMSPANNEPFDKSLYFTRGKGRDRQTLEAQIFFQMTRAGIDYTVRNGERVFTGHSDIVLLKLIGHEDPFYKPIRVLRPEEIKNQSNVDIGITMSCHGFPLYKTARRYGECSGTEFAWKQEYARAFEDDLSDGKRGVASNLASGPGMSGGPCNLMKSPAEIFAIVSNGFFGGDALQPTLPNLAFNGNYAGGSATYLSLFHVLDARLRAELGFGVSEISRYCR